MVRPIETDTLIDMHGMIPVYIEMRAEPGRIRFAVAKRYDEELHGVMMLGNRFIIYDIDKYNRVWRAWDGQYGPPTLAEREAAPWGD